MTAPDGSQGGDPPGSDDDKPEKLTPVVPASSDGLGVHIGNRWFYVRATGFTAGIVILVGLGLLGAKFLHPMRDPAHLVLLVIFAAFSGWQLNNAQNKKVIDNLLQNIERQAKEIKEMAASRVEIEKLLIVKRLSSVVSPPPAPLPPLVLPAKEVQILPEPKKKRARKITP